MQYRWKSRILQIFKNERGDGQIIIYLFGVILFIIYTLFSLTIYKYMLTVSEINDVSDTIMKDAMQINNGLTPSVESYIYQVLEAKGLDTSKVTITGTPSPTPFGSPLEGSISYEYTLINFNTEDNFIPELSEATQVIESNIYTFSLGIVR